jgi:PASTA domain
VPVPNVPNVVGLTQAAAISSNQSLGFQTILQYAASSSVAAGIVISQNTAFGTAEQVGFAVIIVVSTGPAQVASMGGDVWGSTGGGQSPVNAPAQIGQELSVGAAPANALYSVPNKSVLSAIATGTISQSTPGYQVPTTPAVG